MRKKIFATALIAFLLTSTFFTLTAFAATEEDIEASIVAGLQWLAAQQSPAGYWTVGSEHVGVTGFAVLKFIDRAKELGMSPFDEAYEYNDTVIDGLNFLFTRAYTRSIGLQPHGDPDGDGDGIGVYFESFSGPTHRTYSTAISLMAIASAVAADPTQIVVTGPLAGWTYADVVQDMVDYFAFGQNDFGSGRGAWRYTENSGLSDNSNAGWVTLGLGYAQLVGVVIPQFVLDELSIWIDYIQNDINGDTNDGGSGYADPNSWVNMLKTGNLLYQMALVGDDEATPRVADALAYQERHWNDFGSGTYTVGWKGGYPYFQATYCIMKGYEALGIENITVGAMEVDWFDEISTAIVNSQSADGSWPPSYWVPSRILSTVWALLTLEKAVAVPRATVAVDIKPGSWPNPINKDKNGVVSVAICGTEDFDVMTIDPATVAVYAEGIEDGVSALRWSYEDAATPYDDTTPDEPDGHEETADGYIDLVLKFDVPELVETLDLCEIDDWEYVKLFLKGRLFEEEGGRPVEGFDWVRIQSSKGKDK